MLIPFILLPFLLLATPSESFINEHGNSVIEAEIMYKLSKPEVYHRFSPLFTSAIEKEKETGFFGYHATSLDVSFFHDILREVIEKKLDIPLPQDFYFFRTPLDSLYDLKNAKSYLEERKGTVVTEAVIREGVKKAFLDPLSNLPGGIKVSYEELSPEDREILFRPVLEAHNLIADLYSSMTKKLTLKNKAKSQLPIPITQLLQKLNESAKEKYEELLEEKEIITEVGKTLRHLVERKQSAPLSEEQTVLIASLTSENKPLLRILELVYNLDLKKESPYIRWFLPYNDNFPKNSSRLLSLNIPLFGNIFNRGDSTAHVFLTGKTVAKNDAVLAFLLEDYFEKLGFRRELATELFQKIHDLFSEQEEHFGVLYQFFDTSPTFQFLDKLAYVSFPYGAPAEGITPSELALETRTIDYGGQQAQLRLLMSSSETLNPMGTLSMKRYDSLSSEKRAAVKELIHQILQKEPLDPERAAQHKKELLSSWRR